MPDLEGASAELLQESLRVPSKDAALENEIDGLCIEGTGTTPSPLWPSDSNAPDYAHLDAPRVGQEFHLAPDDLELLIKANGFDPQDHNGTIVFGLRGASLASGHQIEDVGSLAIVDERPNHLTQSCLIGFYDRLRKTLSGYTGSTVPDGREMLRYFKWHAGLGDEAWTNMLPTGCYTFRRASYAWNAGEEDWEVPVALRLTDPGTTDTEGTATVLRTNDDLSYETKDFWHKTKPADCIRPAFSTVPFTSSGCLTVRGSNERFSLEASDQWARFQTQIMRIPKNGRIDMVLLTGAEACIAAQLRGRGEANDQLAVSTALGRLRVGSSGPAVKRLQQMLGVRVDGEFGPATKLALVEFQRTLEPLGEADGIYSREMDADLGETILDV